MKVLVTDADYSSLDIEAEVLAAAGHELVVASCRTPQEVIAAAAGVDALLVQFAPITAEVFEALPQLELLSRYGVGVDVVDTEAARDHGVWVCNVPDYGTTEVAMHAVAMLLALLRNVAGHDREVRAGHWDYHLGGQLRRPSSLTLGVVGLGRIGGMAAERAAPWFGAVVGYDPYLTDSDWPNRLERLSLGPVRPQFGDHAAPALDRYHPRTGRNRSPRADAQRVLLGEYRPGWAGRSRRTARGAGPRPAGRSCARRTPPGTAATRSSAAHPSPGVDHSARGVVLG